MANKLQLNLMGGMNAKTSPLIIKDNEAELIVNYNLDEFGSATKRKGYTRYLTQPNANKSIIGLFQFNDTSGNSNIARQLMALNSDGSTQKIYYNNSGTWTEAASYTISSAAFPRVNFVSFVGYVFRANGRTAMSSSADGITWGTTNCRAVSTFNSGYMAVFQDRLYVSDRTANQKSRIYFSSLPDMTTSPEITWDTNDWFEVNPDDNDEITALENNGNRLLIFKNYALYRWTFGQVEPDKLIGVGTSSQWCVKTNFDIGVTFFANQNGVYAYSGGRPKLISRKIQPYINAVSDWTAVLGEVDDDHYYLQVGDITVNDKTISNAMFVYHISLDAWSIYSLANAPTIMARMIAEYPNSTSAWGESEIYFGAATGRTYKFLDGTDDDDNSIATEFISKEYLLSFPQRTNFTWLDMFSQSRGNANIFYDLDRLNQFAELGQLQARITNFRIPTRECNSVRIKVAENSKVASSIEGFNMEHMPKEKRDENTVQIRRRGIE